MKSVMLASEGYLATSQLTTLLSPYSMQSIPTTAIIKTSSRMRRLTKRRMWHQVALYGRIGAVDGEGTGIALSPLGYIYKRISQVDRKISSY